ncbi:pollen-specific leucine-rich repeat extensin-like protein 1 [Drosophila guanche]|uniref:Uncharacterized protein n=1 Tax=Drosophila guanche TaxID=7266 RepID=A0A3B0K3Z7_DROGU|nr:pollen-specific leucine-rich repeat extensin-like protein 1 [Drosophila guanche]SPP79691.1 Hypothetical predicted protein [Drosophila guanche]
MSAAGERWKRLAQERRSRGGKGFEALDEWTPPRPYEVMRRQNCKTAKYRAAETYPSIRPPVSRCSRAQTIAWLADSIEADGCGRPNDMTNDDILKMWHQSPHKNTLGYYGVESQEPQSEVENFNKQIQKSLEMANGPKRRTKHSRAEGPRTLPSVGTKKQATTPGSCLPMGCGLPFVLNREAIKAVIQKMPTVKRKLSPSHTYATVYCKKPQDPIDPFGVMQEQQPQPDGEKEKQKRRHYPYCGWRCNQPQNQCTDYEWKKYKLDPRPIDEAFKREQAAQERQPREPEPRNYDELFSRLVTCFETLPMEDPMCKDFVECCIPKRCEEDGPGAPGGATTDEGGDKGVGGETPGQPTGEGYKPGDKPKNGHKQGYGEKPSGDGDKPEDGGKPGDGSGDGGKPGGKKDKPNGDPNDPKGGKNKPKGDPNDPAGGKNKPKGDPNDPTGGKNKPKGDPNDPNSDRNRPKGDPNYPSGGEKNKGKKEKPEKEKDLEPPEKPRPPPKRPMEEEPEPADGEDGESKHEPGEPTKKPAEEKKDKAKEKEKEKGKDKPADKTKQPGDPDAPKKPDGKDKPKRPMEPMEKPKRPMEKEPPPVGDSEPECDPNDPNCFTGQPQCPPNDPLCSVSQESGDGLEYPPEGKPPIVPMPQQPSEQPDMPPPGIEDQAPPGADGDGGEPEQPPEKGKTEQDKCPPCPCDMCEFLRRHKLPDSPLMRKLQRQEKLRQQREYYKQMCHRQYMECRTPEYPAPQHKCDPIVSDNAFCRNPKLGEYCECLKAMQDLQQLLGKKHRIVGNQLLFDLEDLKSRLCKRMCDCL